jgi:hypothetical protein
MFACNLSLLANTTMALRRLSEKMESQNFLGAAL